MELTKELPLEPRWARRKDARASELTAAALDLFVERGYAATRLDDVAARAGVSKGTVYLYFDNKAELFKAVVREGIVPLIADAEAALSHYQGPSGDLLRGLILGWWQSVGQSKLLGIPKLVISEAGNFPEIAKFYADEVISRGHVHPAKLAGCHAAFQHVGHDPVAATDDFVGIKLRDLRKISRLGDD